MPGLFRSLLAVLLAAAATLPAGAATEADVNAAIGSRLGSPDRYAITIRAFQQAVATGAREDVAAFVRYPIVVEIGGRKRTITSAQGFVRSYDEIMAPDIVAAVKDQKYQDLFVSARGIMFGSGEVWIDGICFDRKCRSLVPMVVTIRHTDAH